MNEKEAKEDLRRRASADPDREYPVETLKQAGFQRFQCDSCKCFFWSAEHRDICGDPACTGGFQFIGSPTKKPLSYIDVWKEFSKIHKKLGYTPVDRYPVVARWNPTTDFAIASIAAFQPFVVSGEIAPPANPLVIPQMCVRFPDIDNVGITGHCVAFIMLGQHAFVPPEQYDKNKYISDHLTWLQKGMGLSLKELTVHEDAWAGGGNLGPSMEFFSKGLEISNQVYMQYELTPSGLQDLNIKVLDMGQGYERVAWFTQGKESNYETTFPSVVKMLRDKTGIKKDSALMKKFTPLSPLLNVCEVSDMNSAWNSVAKKLNLDVKSLKEKILPNASLYAVAEHSRALLVALSDGALPSNVGGMYNLRVILRRALGFIDKYNWDVKLQDVCAEHAKYLKPLFPEFSENLDSVNQILDVEERKYRATKEKTERMLPKLMEKEIRPEKLVDLYDSQGIAPELIRDAAEEKGKSIKIPDNFYALLAERHEEQAHVAKTEREEKLPIEDLPSTEALYFDDYTKISFNAEVIAIIGNNVLLNETAFYPFSGGQLSDAGTLNGDKVVDVFKQGPHIVHVMEKKPKFHAGDTVHGEVDFDRRLQLAQHHTATHIINAAAKLVLGKHANQASAKKDIDKAHIDLTHYDALTDEQVAKIEEEANKIVKQGIKTDLSFMPREEAEKKYGMSIYQGGVAPGKDLRIVKIADDVEACGGTHLKNTLEAGKISILKASKVQDGVVRITFAAGKAAEKTLEKEKHLLEEIATLLSVDIPEIPSRSEELFEVWKKARKAAKKKQSLDHEELELVKKEKFDGDVLARTAEILNTQPDVIVNTLKRFLSDIEKFKK